MSKKIAANEGVPQLSKMEKLEQIRSGKTLQRRKSRIDIKDIIVLSGKDGSKITKKQMAEKFEETTVKRKKKNYIMYESKLGTEKNTEITKIAGPKPKKAARPVRTPVPRIEERIIQKRKKLQYLDNYQYLETRVLRRKNPSVVVHKRLGDILYGDFEETMVQKQIFSNEKNSPIYQDQKSTTRSKGMANRRKPTNSRAEMVNLRPLDTTSNNLHKRTNSNISNSRNPETHSTTSSQIVTNQIMSRRGAPQTNESKPETKRTINNFRTRSQPRTPMTIASNNRNNTRVNDNEPKKLQESISTKTITTSTTIRRRGNNDNSPTKSETKIETKVERRGIEDQNNDEDRAASIRKKYQRNKD